MIETFQMAIAGVKGAAGNAAADFQFDALPLRDAGGFNGFSVTATIATGTPTGTLKWQASNDSLTWADVLNADGSTAQKAIVSGSPASTMFNVSNIFARYVRLVWVFTSGTGTITALGTLESMVGP